MDELNLPSPEDGVTCSNFITGVKFNGLEKENAQMYRTAQRCYKGNRLGVHSFAPGWPWPYCLHTSGLTHLTFLHTHPISKWFSKEPSIELFFRK